LPDRTVNIIGVGNLLMGDDGVGPAAVERLSARRLPPGVRVLDAGLAVSDVLGTLDPADPLIVIDAVRGGGAAGTVYEVRLDPAPPGPSPAMSGRSPAPPGPSQAMSGRSPAPPGPSPAMSGRSPAAEGDADGTALSLHELSVLPALRLEAVTGRVFEDVTVLGVEPAKVAWGEGLSPAVEEAMGRVVEAALVRARQASRWRGRARRRGRGAAASIRR
jgi:Ni,Fe-hydrogenase maturation factor